MASSRFLPFCEPTKITATLCFAGWRQTWSEERAIVRLGGLFSVSLLRFGTAFARFVGRVWFLWQSVRHLDGKHRLLPKGRCLQFRPLCRRADPPQLGLGEGRASLQQGRRLMRPSMKKNGGSPPKVMKPEKRHPIQPSKGGQSGFSRTFPRFGTGGSDTSPMRERRSAEDL